MNMTHYEPWHLLNQLHSDMNQMFRPRRERNSHADAQVRTSDWAPAVDIKEEENQYVIHADVPGVDPENIEIHMEKGILTIKGERHAENQEDREGYKRVERVRGSFLRRFSLPDTADQDSITAKARNGVLEIIIPKQEQLQPRRIQVQS